jgi:hypothetical protein
MPALIVKADAVFEAALGIVLIVGGATGALAAADFPPVGRPLIIVTEVILLSLALVIWRLPPTPETLGALALGNTVTALLGVAWLGLASGFSAQGAALTGAVVAVLVCLACAQTVATITRASGESSAAPRGSR